MAIAFDANLGTVTNAATLTTSAAAAASSRVFLFAGWFGTQTINSSFSTGGLSWVTDKQFRGSGGGDQNIALCSADAPSGLASSTALTPTFSATPSFGPGFAAASFTGIATGTSGYLDGTPPAGKDDFEEVWTTNNIVTTNADDLLIGMSLTANGGSHTAGGSQTEMHEWFYEGIQEIATVYRIVSSTSTYQMGGTWSTAVDFETNLGAAYMSGTPAAAVNPFLPDFARNLFPFIPANTNPWLPK